MNSPLAAAAPHPFVTAGVQAIVEGSRRVLPIRAGADLSHAPQADRGIVEISARVTAGLPDREFAPAFIAVQDRVSYEALIRRGIPADLLPCAALHAWRLSGGTGPPEPQPMVAMDTELFSRFASVLSRHGLQPVAAGDVTEIYSRCAGGLTTRLEVAAFLAGRGAPSILVGDEPGMDELGLPCRPSEHDPEEVADVLVHLIGDASVRRRLIALERRAFRAYCDVLHRAAGEPDGAGELNAQLAAIRQSLAASPAEQPAEAEPRKLDWHRRALHWLLPQA